MQVIVDPEGKVALVKMEQFLGYCLDQKVINSICHWRFKPATKEGSPVAVQIRMEVTFRLY